MKNAKRILAIGAHPDDIEHGCGGTLLKYSQNGYKIYLMVMTCGEKGGNKEIRKDEQLKSSQIIGAEKVLWGNYQDTELICSRELIMDVEKLLSQVCPDLIFVNYREDTHQDHRNLAQAVITATRYVRNVLFYETPTTQNFSPSVFVDIGLVLDEKMALLGAHASQVKETKIEDLSIIEIAKALATSRGIEGRVKHAEAFIPLRIFLNVY